MIVMVVDPDKEHLMKTKSRLVRDGTEVVTFCDAMSGITMMWTRFSQRLSCRISAGRECRISGYYLKPLGDGLNLLHGEAATG